MRVSKRLRVTPKKLKSGVNGKRNSFRDLKAFGIWADRTDVIDPAEYTKELRSRMESGNDAR